MECIQQKQMSKRYATAYCKVGHVLTSLRQYVDTSLKSATRALAFSLRMPISHLPMQQLLTMLETKDILIYHYCATGQT
jgi:hypothetical protein